MSNEEVSSKTLHEQKKEVEIKMEIKTQIEVLESIIIIDLSILSAVIIARFLGHFVI